MFVGDDAIEITNVGGRIIARANNVASTFLEVRGIGVVNVAKMYGISKIKKPVQYGRSAPAKSSKV